MSTTDELSKIAARMRTLAAVDDFSPKAVVRRLAEAARQVGKARDCGAFGDPEFTELCEILDLAKATALTPGQGFRHPYSEAFRCILDWCCRELPAPRQLVFMLKPHDRLKPYERYDLIQGWVAPEYVETNLRALADLVAAQALTSPPPPVPQGAGETSAVVPKKSKPKYTPNAVPAWDDPDVEWMDKYEMAEREHTNINVLRSARNAKKDGAVKDTDGKEWWGVDRCGRWWRKKTTNTKDVRYAIPRESHSDKK